MADYCKHCLLKGNIFKCEKAICSIHEIWNYTEILKQKTDQLEFSLNFIKNYIETLKEIYSFRVYVTSEQKEISNESP